MGSRHGGEGGQAENTEPDAETADTSICGVGTASLLKLGVLLYIGFWLSIATHEIGHVLGRCCVGLPAKTVRVGWPVWVRYRVHGTDVLLGPWVGGGGETRGLDHDSALVAIGGALANLVAWVAVVFAIRGLGELGLSFGVTPGLAGFSSLIPFRQGNMRILPGEGLASLAIRCWRPS